MHCLSDGNLGADLFNSLEVILAPIQWHPAFNHSVFLEGCLLLTKG